MAHVRHTFPRSHRLKLPSEFSAVYAARVREGRGPLLVYALPNGLGHSRLGLSVSRKVGVAPRRNRIKRLLREAYRQSRHELPSGYDWVVVIAPHVPLRLAEYQTIFSSIVVKLHRTWERRRESSPPRLSTPTPLEGATPSDPGSSVPCAGC